MVWKIENKILIPKTIKAIECALKTIASWFEKINNDAPNKMVTGLAFLSK